MLVARDATGRQMLAWRAEYGVEYFCPECDEPVGKGETVLPHALRSSTPPPVVVVGRKTYNLNDQGRGARG